MRAACRLIALIVATLISAASLVTGFIGVLGNGGEINVAFSWPTLLTGVICSAAVLGAIARKSWWLAAGVIGALGHFGVHAMILSRNSASGAVSGGRLVGLFAVPVLWAVLLLVLGLTTMPKPAPDAE